MQADLGRLDDYAGPARLGRGRAPTYMTQAPRHCHFGSRALRKITQWSFAPGSGLRVSRWQNARKCYGRMDNHLLSKRAKNDTKAIKRGTVSVKNVKNEYDFVLPSLTARLQTPLGASAKPFCG